MFTLFPTITILDTLDKAGKDAYTGSSMALTISRVPDTLFDKSAPVPAAILAPPIVPPPVPVSTSFVSKRTYSKAVMPVVRTASKVSVKSKPDTKPATVTASKKGKLGKLGKAAIATKKSSSARAGLLFPAARLKRRLK